MKRMLLILFAAAALFFVLAPSVGAADALAYAESGFTDAADFVPDGEGILLWPITSRNWLCEGYVQSSHRTVTQTTNGERPLTILSATLPGAAEVPEDGAYVTFTLDLSRPEGSLDAGEALQFGLYIDRPGEYEVTASLLSSEGELTGRARASGVSVVSGSPEWNRVTVDLSGFGGTAESLAVTVTLPEGALPYRIMITAPYATETVPEGLLAAEAYCTYEFTEEIGSFSARRGRGTADERGRMLLTGELLMKEPLPASAELFFEVRLGRFPVNGGTLAVSVIYEGQAAEERRLSRPVNLTASDGVYIIPISASAPVRAYSLQFENLERGQTVGIESVRILAIDTCAEQSNSWIGSLSAVTRIGPSVHFEGTMTREAVRSFSGESLGFYGLPAFSSTLEDAVPVGGTKVSTRFEYTVDLSALPVSADTYRFFAAMKADDGTLLPLDAPRYCAAGEPNPAAYSPIGLYAALPVGAFESNVSQVLVDVPLDRLLSGEAGSAVSYTVYGETSADGEAVTRSVVLAADVLAELDRDIPFYRSAGIRVWLRLTAASPVPGLTCGGLDCENYAVDLRSNESRHRYAAVIRALSARYSDIEGLVVGTAMNDPRSVGDLAAADPAEFAEALAQLCRITYNAASRSVPGILVCLPFGENGDGPNDRSLAVMTAERLREIGEIPWAVFRRVRTGEEALADAPYLSQLFDSLSLPRPVAEAALYQLPEEAVEARYPLSGGGMSPAEFHVSEFFAFSEACGRARAVFYSLDGIPFRSDHDFYDLIKRSAGTGGSVYDSDAREAGEEENGAQIALWDFSDKHYALDWLPGGGMLSCATEYSGIFSEERGRYTRALSAVLQETDSGAAGIAICNLAGTADLTDVDSLTFTFAAEGSADTAASLVFIVGNDEDRAEFYAGEVPCGEIRRMSCDLAGWDGRNRTDYVGVVVYADDGVTLRLESVTARSEALGEDALEALFHPSAEEPAPRSEEDLITLLLILFSLAAASAVVFVLLTRHERESEPEDWAEAGRAVRRS